MSDEAEKRRYSRALQRQRDPGTPGARPLSFYRLLFVFRHHHRIGFCAVGFDVLDAGTAVGPEEHAENSGDEVVVIRAAHDVIVFFALRAACAAVFRTTSADSAPGRFVIFSAAGTAFFEIAPAGAAEKTTACNEVCVGGDGSHKRLLDWRMIPTGGRDKDGELEGKSNGNSKVMSHEL